MIPFKVLPLGENEINAVVDVIKSKSIGMGKKVKEFEERIAEYAGAKYAVAVDSCTSALFLSLKYCALDNAGHLPIPVRIPSMTVPLVASTVVHAGGRIHFEDECDWVGHSYQLKPYPIIDSAHKVTPNQYTDLHDDKMLLCYSFYPTKPITSCEGGVILTNDEKAAEWLTKARFYGRNSGETVAKNSWEYDIEFPGWKMNMTEIQAALCIEQIKRLPLLDINRQLVVSLYNYLLGLDNDSLYLYRINVLNRDKFINYMKDNGVECGVHFKPLHLMEAFKDCQRDELIKTEAMGKYTVSLPLYDSLNEKDTKFICKLVREWQEKGDTQNG
jgi:dTDP-4-amino-4,6-dideoxygalactose transaminase